PGEQPVPGVGADRGDHLERAFRNAEPDGSPEAGYVWQEIAHGVLATRIDRKDEEYRRGGQRTDHRLRCRLLNRLRWHSLRSPSASSAPSFPHPPATYTLGPPRSSVGPYREVAPRCGGHLAGRLAGARPGCLPLSSEVFLDRRGYLRHALQAGESLAAGPLASGATATVTGS